MRNARSLRILMLGAAALGVACATAWAQEPLKVGEAYPIQVDSSGWSEVEGVSTPTGQVYEVSHPGATYIAVHFKRFHLAAGDSLIVSDAEGGQSYVLEGKGKMNAGKFWSQHVKGDTIVLELVSTGKQPGKGFVIDEYAAGIVDLGPGIERICGANDFENAVCRAPSIEYDRARAVARLLIQATYLCTGWLASANSHFITNEHCITSSADALNTDYEFMAEAPTCGSANCQLCYPGTIYSGSAFIQDSPGLDYALVQLAGNPAASYGYLELDNRTAVVGEQVYLVSYPAGRAKEFAYNSTGDVGGVGRVISLTEPTCSGATLEIGYWNDTEGGSSGSPVLTAPSHKVIALHHCHNYCDTGGLPNRGVPIDQICVEIGAYIPSCAGGCTSHAQCNDFNDCTEDLCVATVCPNNPYPDNTPCTGGVCCAGTCTAPFCSNDAGCNDANACTIDTCLDPGLCTASCLNDPIVCPPGQICVDGACVYCTINAHCDDSDACTLDVCTAGVCSNTPITCDDANLCTVDTCDPAIGCVFDPVVCPPGQTCVDGVCVPGGVPDTLTAVDNVSWSISGSTLNTVWTPATRPPAGSADVHLSTIEFNSSGSGEQGQGDIVNAFIANDFSTEYGVVSEVVSGALPAAFRCAGLLPDTCALTLSDSFTGASFAVRLTAPTQASISVTQVQYTWTFTSAATCVVDPDCDDLNACTLDVCTAGVCSNTPITCDDADLCTADTCDPGIGCVFTSITCDDASLCTTDSCDPAIGCVFTPITCDDLSLCTTDTCDPGTGCVYTPITCDDADLCTTDSCDTATGCVFTPITCDDANLCTIDSCDPAVGCVFDPIVCPPGQTCVNGICEVVPCTVDPDCDDLDACTLDVCTTGVCSNTPITCDDASVCTTDTCDPAIGCVFTPITCDDASLCTTDTCDAITGCLFTPIVCDDLDLCTTDTCEPATGCVFTPITCPPGQTCVGGVCTAPTCSPVNGPCSVDADCCPPGHCDDNNGVLVCQN